MHKAGFVNIIGLPNAGKSSLTNALLGWNLNIVNKKPQTTRHRIHAIINGDDFQMVIGDTPGFIRSPEYAMQEAMNKSALSVTEDADILLMVHDVETPREESQKIFEQVKERSAVPCILILNKCDKLKPEEVLIQLKEWADLNITDHIFPVSALKGSNIKELKSFMANLLPEHPPFYPKDEVSDRNVRFFISEIIRNHILDQFHKEIPYSCQVIIEDYKSGNENEKTQIRATIFVMRNSQRQILIGRGGSAIKKLGMAARKDIETFLEEKVYLDLTVKIKENWRDDEDLLKKLGYQ